MKERTLEGGEEKIGHSREKWKMWVRDKREGDIGRKWEVWERLKMGNIMGNKVKGGL